MRPSHALLATLLVAIATGASYGLRSVVGPSDLAMISVGAIVLAAFFFGRWPSVLASALSVPAYDFFFVPPFYTFAVSDPHHLATFSLVFFITRL